MRKLLLCGALVAAAAIVPVGSATAAKPLRNCSNFGFAQKISEIQKRGPSCQDTRVLIRSVESHASQCKPYREATVAPFRECTVTPALSVGTRDFTCRSAFETQGDNKRYWRTECTSRQGDIVRYRRDGNAP
jgi:hypothetical protein